MLIGREHRPGILAWRHGTRRKLVMANIAVAISNRCNDGIVHANESVRSPGEVIQAMVAAFDTGDVGMVDEVVHADYLDHQGLPHLRPIRGIDGFRQVVEAARGGYDDLHVTIVDLIEGVDRAAARLVWSGVRRTGEATERETLEIVRIDTGRAVEHWGGHS